MIMTTCHDFWSLRWVICPVCPAQTRDITSSGWVRRDQPERTRVMGSTVIDVSMSIDGFVAGPNDSEDSPLGLIDELHIHLVPVLLGRGVRLFEDPGTDPIGWAAPEVTPSPRVTHLRYRRPSS